MKNWRASVLILILFLGHQIVFSNDSNPSFQWLKIRPEPTYENFDWSVLPEEVSKEMLLSLIQSPYVLANEPVTVFPISGKYYAVFPCRLDIVEWSGTEWVNLYQGYAAGFNCLPYFFVRDGQIYSYGKYGFWEAHSEIMYFDFQTGYWENVSAKNVPLSYAGVGTFRAGDTLVSLFGQYLHQSSGTDRIENNGYHFNFKTGEWHPFDIQMPNQTNQSLWMLQPYEGNDFGLMAYKHLAELGFLIFDKGDFSLHFKRIDYTPLIKSSISFASRNDLWFFDESTNAIHINFDTDLETEFRPIGKVIFNQQGQLDKSKLNNWLIGLLILAGFYLTYLFYKGRDKKSRSKPIKTILEPNNGINSEPEEEVSQLIQHLLQFANQSFEVDQLDQLLGIYSIQHLDYRRVKRNRLIKTINKEYRQFNGRVLIDREKSDKDKRVILYRILMD
jgi:hypothetical protein